MTRINDAIKELLTFVGNAEPDGVAVVIRATDGSYRAYKAGDIEMNTAIGELATRDPEDMGI